MPRRRILHFPILILIQSDERQFAFTHTYKQPPTDNLSKTKILYAGLYLFLEVCF